MDLSEQIERLEKPVFRFAFSLTRNRERAEDVTQECLCRAWAHAAVLAGSPEAKLRSWLFTVARHLVIDQARTSAREVFTDDGVPEPGENTPAVATLESTLAYESTLGTLPAALGDVVRLNIESGMTSGEIGARLGVAPATVRWRLRTGLRILRNTIQSQER